MKKLLFSTMLIAAALVSCQKDTQFENKLENPEKATVKLIANAIAPVTKTVIENDYSVSWAATGEVVALIELNSDAPTAASPFYYTSTGYTRSDAKNAQFTFSLNAASGDDFDYYAAYPESAVKAVSVGASGYNEFYFTLPELQTPSATSVDPKGVIIVAAVENQASRPASLDFSFSHAAAYGKMTLKNVQTLINGEALLSIKISSSGKKISGRMNYCFAPNATNGHRPAGTMTSVPNTKDYVIINADNIVPSDNFDVWFTCWPFELTSGETLLVSVITDKNTYTTYAKTATIPESKTLSFEKGKISHFTVNMSTANEVTVKVNGTTLSQINATDYSGVVNFTQNAVITFSGLNDIASYYFDPDYLYLDGADMKFYATTGLYTVDILGGNKDIRFKRMANATTKATINEHGLWLMGWGVASPSMENNEFGFNPGASYCMAEIVNNHRYRFSGKASNGQYDQTVGTRFRSDYLSFKYFAQDGWGNEKGKMFGTTVPVELTAQAQELLKDVGNLELKDGVTLEPGKTYVLIIDLNDPAREIIDFYKQD